MGHNTAHSAPGFGDPATWPKCSGHHNDPRTEDRDDFDAELAARKEGADCQRPEPEAERKEGAGAVVVPVLMALAVVAGLGLWHLSGYLPGGC